MLDKTIRELTKAIKNLDGRKTSAYDTPATVMRIEDGIAYVHIPGGVDETPVKLTVNASPGDTVQIRVGGGEAWIVGNETSPPTDDKRAIAVENNLSITDRIVQTVKKVAEATAKIAGDTAQFFWVTESGTDTGAHITEKPQEEFIADPENGGANLLARSNGIAVRNGLTELATFSANGIRLGNDEHMALEQTEQNFTFYDDDVAVTEIEISNHGIKAKNTYANDSVEYGADGLVYTDSYGNSSALDGSGVHTDGDLEADGGVISGGTSLTYVPGDTLTIAAWPVSGYITTGGQDVLFFFSADKILSGVTDFNVTGLVVNLRHVGSGYVGGADYNALNDISAKYVRGNYIYIRCKKTAGYGVTNNTPICGEIKNATIVFS